MLKQPHKLRVLLLGAAITTASLTVMARLAYLQVAEFDSYSQKANRQHTSRITLQPERGAIQDRNGTLLASSTRALSVFINPTFFRPPEFTEDVHEVARQVADHAGLDYATVLEKFNSTHVVSVGRQMNPEVAQKIGDIFDDFDISSRGYWFDQESKRQYITGMAPHILGFTGKDEYGDNRGLAGLEYKYADEISGKMVEARVARSGMAQVMQPVEEDDLMAARGHTIITTLDASIQQEAEKALAAAAAEFEADTAGAIVMDVHTGAILAMASWPSFDNNQAGTAPPDHLRNRLLTDPLETGSVVKLFTAAILLDQGLIDITTPVDCGGGSAYFGRRQVRDAPGHYMNVVPFYEVMRYSSNVGTIRATENLENDIWYEYLRNFGLGSQTGIDLPGEGTGILYPVSKWTSFSRSSLPMGYELALTPTQIVMALGALVNGGKVMEPYVVQKRVDPRGNIAWKREPVIKHQVISARTSLMMRELMEDVVVNGTGKSAQIPGFRVGGKTGTTRKSDVFTHREYIASFGGALPINDPRVAIYCYVDNPKGKYYGGSVAAPIFHAIAQECVLQLGILPTEEIQPSKAQTKLHAPEVEPDAARNSPLLRFSADNVSTNQRVPNFFGLSMMEARHVLQESYTNVRFQGSGLVVEQIPEPGTLMDPALEIVLIFSQENEPRKTNTSIVAESAQY